MVISVKDWLFDVDTEATAAYCDVVCSDPCQCGYCRNFRLAVNGTFPSLDLFLNKLGSSVMASEELMPYEPTIYEGSYCVSGKVLHSGANPLVLDDCNLTVMTAEETDYDPQCPKPYFVLRTQCLELPWVLNEDMDEVISPANEPEYLQRMWDRLLRNAPPQDLDC